MHIPLILFLTLSLFDQTSLKQADTTFGLLDSNGDKLIGASEYTVLSKDRSPFLIADHDGNGSLDRDEFLVFYAQRLKLAGQTPDADLEAESTRVVAARRSKQAGAGPAVQRRRTQPADPAPVPSTAPTITDGLKAALDALDARAAQGKATPEDVQAVKNQLIARARAAANAKQGDPSALEQERALQAKWLQSLERMEAAAREGKFSRQEFTAFREELNQRLRNQANEAQGNPPAPAPTRPVRPPQPAPEPAPAPAPVPGPTPEPKPEPKPEVRPRPAPEPNPQPAPQPAPEPQPQPQRPPQRPKPGV